MAFTSFQSPILRLLQERHYIYQISDPQALDQKILQGPITVYIGFDCTAPSLHVGSLIQIMLLRHFQLLGHKPIILLGGGTTQVGDPSFRAVERPLLDAAEIETNKNALKKVFECFLTFGDGPADAVMLDNAAWLSPLNYIAFLREYGAYVSVNRMLSFDSVRFRLEREQSLSFLEFNYPLLQAYDFLHLSRQYGCALQMGGSDQWGNIVLGIDLAHKKDGRQLFGLTSPLLTTHGGQKMGKTARGAVWLNANMLSPYDYWQYWRSIDDADLERFFLLFTHMPVNTIRDLCQNENVNEAKKQLATHITALLHGHGAAQAACLAAQNLFEKGQVDLSTLPVALIMTRQELSKGVGLLSVCVKAGLCESLSQARRLIRGGGVRLNDVVVQAEDTQLFCEDIRGQGYIKLALGKKRIIVIRVDA